MRPATTRPHGPSTLCVAFELGNTEWKLAMTTRIDQPPLERTGFPDRILWHKVVSRKYPAYDITRVGIYGGSAGGQNSLGGLLFHPEFYDAAVSFAGCHDNRKDKIWWNEQWMGWPIGPQYDSSSNVVNAWKLKGKLLLVVGELDTNFDPSSTCRSPTRSSRRTSRSICS